MQILPPRSRSRSKTLSRPKHVAATSRSNSGARGPSPATEWIGSRDLTAPGCCRRYSRNSAEGLQGPPVVGVPCTSKGAGRQKENV